LTGSTSWSLRDGRVTKTPFAEITDEEFEASVDQNLRAAFYVLREAARRVADNGRIVTITPDRNGARRKRSASTAA
jgi:NAD(P)-dependent dehydrogenase (short-subunit alcohol dehydrogenase family)